jgi:hypothetical protein
MSNIKQIIELHDIGSRQLEFQATISVDEFWKLAKETNRVFLLQVGTWDSETGKAKISLVPGRGVIYVEKGKE